MESAEDTMERATELPLTVPESSQATELLDLTEALESPDLTVATELPKASEVAEAPGSRDAPLTAPTCEKQRISRPLTGRAA